MFAAIRRDGFGSYVQGLIVPLLIQTASAFLLPWLVVQTVGLNYARSVAFLANAGLAAGLVVDLSNWNRWGFSGSYSAVSVIDYLLTGLLAGLVIAKVAKPRTT